MELETLISDLEKNRNELEELIRRLRHLSSKSIAAQIPLRPEEKPWEEVMEVSIRLGNVLRSAYYAGWFKTPLEICNHTYRELMHLKNMGRKSMAELEEELKRLGLRLRLEGEPAK